MAKSSTFFGLRRGSTKSLTFQVNNGQQITKDRVTEVKNPQTEAQMIQRFVMNTVIRAYSQFQTLCDHSFENVAVGMDSMKNFISLNCGALRARVAAAIDNGEDLYGLYAFTPKGEKYLCPNAYVISRGSLPEVTTTIPALLACVPLGSGVANTYQGVIDALGLQRGDQLTFVTVEGNGPTRIAMRYARVILDPQNADGSEASLSSAFVGADNKINLPNVRNEGTFLGLTFADNSINFKFTNQGVGAAGVIVSRKVDNMWKRSNCQLVIKASTIAGFFPSLGECLDMVGQSDIATRNALYLNNAGRGRVATQVGNGTFATTNRSGDPVTLVAVTTKMGTLSEVETEMVAVQDVLGNTYYIRNNNQSVDPYEMCLIDDTKYINQNAWARSQVEEATSANTVLWASPSDDFGAWLHSKGVSFNCWMTA